MSGCGLFVSGRHGNQTTPPAQEVYSAQAPWDGAFISGTDASAQTGHMTAARWQTLYEELWTLGILHRPLDPATAYSLSFVQ